MSEALREHESGIIANLLTNYEQCQYVRNLLAPDDFSTYDFREVYRLFLATDSANRFLDAVLDKKYSAVLAKAGGEYGYPWHLDYCVDKLLAATKARQIRADVGKMLREEADEDLPVVLTGYAARIEQASTSDLNGEPARQVAEVLAGLDKPDTESRIFLNIPTLDDKTGGLRKGNVSILGALPSSGKTALALNAVSRCVANSKRVAVFSLEMGVNQLWERLLANMADLSYSAIERRKIQGPEKLQAKVILEACAKSGVHFFDNCITVEAMADKIMRLKPDLVIVDFLQYVRVASQKFNSVADRLEYTVGEFKRIAKLVHCPCHIMILSQHNRGEQGKEVSMFSLKGSSGIEQGGDYIMILDRPCVRDNAEPQEKAVMTLVKNKFGRLGKVNLYFEGDRQRFRELAPDEYYPAPPNPNFEEEKPW